MPKPPETPIEATEADLLRRGWIRLLGGWQEPNQHGGVRVWQEPSALAEVSAQMRREQQEAA